MTGTSIPNTVPWPVELAAAAGLLKKAQSFAAFHKRSTWDFAVSIGELTAAGLSSADLRWLVCRGLIEHADEESQPEVEGRAFRPTVGLRFTSDTCFILSSFGKASIPQPMTDAEFWGPMSADDSTRSTPVPAETTPRTARLMRHKPVWNSDLGRLLLGEILVKQFRRFAANQQLILCSFQEEDWPARIDDPLPRVSRIEPKQRLHETISGLNRRQTNPILRFLGDGTGEGIKWAAVHG
jgi:hypothetical protein